MLYAFFEEFVNEISRISTCLELDVTPLKTQAVFYHCGRFFVSSLTVA